MSADDLGRLRSTVVCQDDEGRPLTVGAIAEDPEFAGSVRGLCDRAIADPNVDEQGRLMARWLRQVLLVLTEHKRSLQH
jgi:hypothetical protein